MGSLLRDLRYALRALLRAPSFTLAAVVTLALGIGANTAIFTVVDAVLLRPLPYSHPERLVGIWERSPRQPGGFNVVSPADFLDWKAQSRTVADQAAIWDHRAALTGIGDAEEVPVQSVSASIFPILGVPAMVGRGFTPDEDAPNGPGAVVLSYGLWKERLGGDRHAIGRSLILDGIPLTIVGVMPAGFSVPGTNAPAKLWTPLGLDPAQDYRATAGRFMKVVGRLAPGATLRGADAEFRAIARRIEAAHPDYNAKWSAVVVGLRDQVVGGTRRPLLVLAGVVAFVLLIACANVANLALARAASHRREVTVRAALGATRWQVMRSQLAESVLVSLMGGALGLLLALWGTAALVAAAPPSLPRATEIGMDARTFAFTVLLSLLTGIAFGVAPALAAARADLQSTLRDGGRGASRSRARGALVVVQVALSLVLLVGAGLMIRSFERLSHVKPGFQPEGVFSAKISLPGARYGKPEQEVLVAGALLDRVRAVPGVKSAALSMYLPFDGAGSRTNYWVGGRPIPPDPEQPAASVLAVSPGYFETLDIPVIRGRPFSSADVPAGHRVVAINQALANSVFRGQDPIGKEIDMPWTDTLRAEVVAVVGDIHSAGLDSLPEPTTYWPLAQFQTGGFALLARTGGDPMQLARPLAEQLHAIDKDLPLADPRPLDSYLGASVAARRFTMLLLGAFAVVAVVLAAIGIAGVMINSVSQRTREIGVRLALGAQPADVRRMVLRQGMLLAGLGIGAGVIGAVALTRVLANLLYGTAPTDALTFAAVIVLLAAVALAANWVPARRATRVDPAIAFRAE